MKLFCALALLAALLSFGAANPQLKQVNTVYILAMSGGMDQFLANQIAASGIFQVVTDPRNADAIITDHVGETFETKLKELYPPPPPPAAPAQEAKQNKSSDKREGLDLGAGVVRVSSSGRGKGNLFIVDRKSRTVLWSIFEPPKDSTPGELSKTAEKVVKRLKNDLSEKKQTSD